MEDITGEMDYSLCLICSSSFITADVKVERGDFDQGDCQSVIKFLLATVLEIPQDEVVLHLKEKLINKQLNCYICESCIKLIYTVKQIYTQILELSQKFRMVQKQIVQQISNPEEDLHCGTTLSTSKNDGLLDFCRKFLRKNNFNGFGYPFIVNDIPVKTSPSPLSQISTKCAEEDPPVTQQIKEEPISENDEDSPNRSSDFSADEDSQSDSDLEPPPSKKPAKKPPIKKPPPKKPNRKSPSAATISKKRVPKKLKLIGPIKQSKFDLLYPNYPKRVRNPFTNKFHCLEFPCSKMYPKKTALERHVIVEHLQDNFYKCEEPLCGKSYASREHFEDHVSWHKGISRWKCEEKVTTANTPPGGESEKCTEGFFTRRKLTRHVQKVHQKDKSFVCEICGKSYSCQDYLTSHKYEKHTENGKATVSKYYEQLGQQICNYCGKSFTVKSSLNIHINLVHEKTVGKFECEFCECRKFRMKGTLKQHLWNEHQFSLEGYQPPIRKTKVKDRNFQCEVKGCRKSFIKEISLRKHMEEKHGGGGGMEGVIYEWNCKYCGKGFHLKGKLEHHQKAHENKESKPFGCEICGNGFATMPYLKTHRWNIHKIPMEKARKNKGV